MLKRRFGSPWDSAWSLHTADAAEISAALSGSSGCATARAGQARERGSGASSAAWASSQSNRGSSSKSLPGDPMMEGWPRSGEEQSGNVSGSQGCRATEPGAGPGALRRIGVAKSSVSCQDSA